MVNKNKGTSPARVVAKNNISSAGLVADSSILDRGLNDHGFKSMTQSERINVSGENTRTRLHSTNKQNFKSSTNQELIDELRDNFHRLSVLRSTDAEALLIEYRESAEKRIIAGERLIESLRKEKDELLARFSSSTEHHTSNLGSEIRSTPIRRISSSYSDISGISRKFNHSKIINAHGIKVNFCSL
jgi:hypothetical protein